MKILVNIMTYNPLGHDNFEIWNKVIEGWVEQRKENLRIDICVCDNISTVGAREWLKEKQKKVPNLYLNFINKRYSMHICWNHTNMLLKNDYDYIVFCCSDCFLTDKDDLSILIEDAKSDSNCIVISPQVSSDMCRLFPEYQVYDKSKAPTRLYVKQAVNGHMYLFEKRFLEAFDYKRIDILMSHMTEPFIGHMCASIKKHESISHRVLAEHIGKMETESLKQFAQPVPEYGDWDKFLKMIEEGREWGLGFMDVFEGKKEPAMMRIGNPAAFDENGYSKTDGLYNYIKDHLFLKSEQLDYTQISHELIR